MKKIFKVNCPLFQGIEQKEIESVLQCLNAIKKSYSKGDYIWHAGDKTDYFGIVVKGQVNIINEDILGNRIVIANIGKHQMFGEAFSIANVDAYPVSAQAAIDSVVILLKSEKLTSTCKNACAFHKILIDNMLRLIARKNIKLNNRINCITKKTTKEKLLFYLVSEMQINNQYEVIIPFNREELADYLGVNRSALSRELSSLKKEGIISFNKNNFKLLDIEKLKDIYSF
ncbi:Crp/Fnr family transcriptional regulator [Paramaledivibacter caminithermalis]|uniref:cAMP-binding domain of CRP or a regulatory subunit of cAMP-dependent protein kinases n=1 Tax=Paramaledivibacter caminithermalis (strain DSM 15212 / CIP 107654 / DViRD3) TaxID=1121301 RepID=A0A1M6RDR6_PARC5|nr:Crp/Fnr family transcriptional regulator [Paramaledivibacter caminithermalis]SHK30497.1 cAMP-binding domain of CRP or a regulatory subunit of cAMP-dependent protein kinases [Paramaledivibacter caminithermalis DSM 15212]